MLPWTRSLLRPATRGIQHTVTRNFRRRGEPDFHGKYGNLILISSGLFCVAVYVYAFTIGGYDLNLSPVGRITPKEWRDE